MDKARIIFRSSGVLVPAYSGRLKRMPGAPTVTGQLTLPVTIPAREAASQRVGTRRSSAYQYQLFGLRSNGSKGWFE